MRNSFLLAASLLTGVVLAAAACSNVGAFGDSFADNRAPNAASGSDPESAVNSDASAPSMGALVSQLCSSAPSCLPDDDGTFVPSAGFTQCGPRLVDGGAEVPGQGVACRIVDTSSVCPPDGGANREGVDGTSCSSGSDCAPGFDCVVGDTGRGAVCRRYCCAGSSACSEHTSQNGGRTFCDVQALEEKADTLVPVCMPIKQCKLLKTGECSASETCAVVSDKGETGCVATGPQEAGASCEKAHCMSGLTCLGSPGDRRCYALCRVSSDSDCEGAKKCTTSSLFPDPNTGVCR